MENIRQAIERVKDGQRPTATSAPGPARASANQVFGDALGGKPTRQTELDRPHLESQQIVAYDGNDLRSRSFDMLRTEVLQSMDLKGWKTLAITSPTPSCGKTFTAVNLALSMARQSERQVFLADLDLRKPRVAASLGLKCNEGVLDVIDGRIELNDAVVQVRVGASKLQVLPTLPAPNCSDLVGSRAMKSLLEDLKRYGQYGIVILDLPPLLTGHDVISILPLVDCVLLVAAIGTTKVSEIRDCTKYLEGIEVLRFVLNKVPAVTIPYVYY
jgi:protein-tyrosine kinase